MTLPKSERRSIISPPVAGVPPAGTSATGQIADEPWFERFAFAGVFFSVRVVTYALEINEETLPTWHPVQFSSVVGIFSSYAATPAGTITRAAPPKWRVDQIFRPWRVLFSCVVDSAGKLTAATPQ